jgi:hypothetical protein
MAKKKTDDGYWEKFNDPKWQQKRLRILERDDWVCQKCGDDTSQLHIHHRYYVWGRNPWEYEDDSLVTLCKDCHKEESDSLKMESTWLNNEIKKRLDSSEISGLVCGMPYVQFGDESVEFFRAVTFAMEYKHARVALMQAYKDIMSGKRYRKRLPTIWDDDV